jgi:exosome complex component RRP46
MTVVSTLIILKPEKPTIRIIHNPTLLEIQDAASVHVMAFTSHRELLVSESEGNFTIDEWDLVYKHAERTCCGVQETADVDAMRDEGDDGGILQFVKSAMQEKIAADLYWKG